MISIHALLAESDTLTLMTGRGTTAFLSTLSLRRATQQKQHKGAYKNISIHALLAESDLLFLSLLFTFLISIHALLAESDRKGWQ